MALRDFVIVPSLDLDLDDGFTVLTGETGAGKSILIDALQLVLGGRADASVVREGATRCEVVAEFDTSPHVVQWLEAQGFSAQAGEPLQLKRQVDAQGRSRAWINGSAATASQLKALADALVDIHGQHAWQSLTRTDSTRQLLDEYARLDTQAVSLAWAAWRAAQEAVQQAQQQQATWAQEQERLLWQLGELDKLSPQPGEWDELNQQQARLAHAQGIIDSAQAALQSLDDDDDSALRRLHRSIQALQAQQDHEPRYASLVQTLQGAVAAIEDTCHDLQHHAHHTELDPAALQAVDQRLADWMSLARRFKCPPEALHARHTQTKQQLALLERQADVDQLQRAEREALATLLQTAEAASRERQAAAQRLSRSVTQAMQTLGMGGGVFEVRVTRLPEPQSHGLDQIEFLVAGHAGSTPRPVGKVASGGELSRIALAIAVSTSQLGQAPTLIFDEVDSGIGGTVAHTVGQLMRQLGHDRQVLAVTHLPQVAACAHHHLYVEKNRSSGGTSSQVSAIDGDTRVRELARMLGGDRLTDTSLAHAKELLCSSS